MQIVEETVTYGWPQGASPYLVVTIYSKRSPCLSFAVYTGYMLPGRLDVLLPLSIERVCSSYSVYILDLCVEFSTTLNAAVLSYIVDLCVEFSTTLNAAVLSYIVDLCVGF